jgi:hypothetical protein
MPVVLYAQVHPVRREFAPEIHASANLAAARASGRQLVRHPRGGTYERIVLDTPVSRESMLDGIGVRHHTRDEWVWIKAVLLALPPVLRQRFAARYGGIACGEWTGAPWRGPPAPPGGDTLLSGGANMAAARTRGGITECGLRIELTHSAMYELRPAPMHRRGVLTLWHELGHFAYRNGFTPRTVEGQRYGQSIHVGAEEQPAYAFMWYFVDPSRLARADRNTFDRVLGRYR